MLLVFAAMIAATVAPSPAIVDEEAAKQARIDAAVEQIEIEAGIYPIGSLPVMEVRKIWAMTHDGPALWIQSTSDVRASIYPPAAYEKLMNSSAASDIGGTVRSKENRAIVSDANIITVRKGKAVEFTAPASQFNFVPSNNTAWDFTLL
jgi:hypothetical protein